MPPPGRSPQSTVPAASPRKKPIALVSGIFLWSAVVATGYWKLARDSFEPGRAGENRTEWPAGLPFAASSTGSTLIVTLHPECGCSAATLGELDRILENCRGELRAIAVFEDYPGLPRAVEDSALWRKAERIPGLQRVKDHEGGIAKTVGARTSGDVCLYDRSGHLAFHGGITAARGHAGANPCSDAVIALVQGKAKSEREGEVRSAPVFGCLLGEEEED